MLSVVWKLDRLGRDLRHLINTVHDLTARDTPLEATDGGASRALCRFWTENP
ncbi:recombinase family protein [Enterobacter hormaechei]|uniref:recombinase family protein n=1 Tax=Enterobacter hormaechei TaxID=158836 RepID=UPI003D09D313